MQQHYRNSNVLTFADRYLIDEEHARMERFLRDLRETCAELDALEDCNGCDNGKAASCQGRLNSFMYDFLDIISEHFENEEKIMQICLSDPEHNEYIRRHLTAHEKLMREIKILMREADELNKHGITVLAIRQIYNQIEEMFKVHAHEYDSYL
jgi:hemerythrin